MSMRYPSADFYRRYQPREWCMHVTQRPVDELPLRLQLRYDVVSLEAAVAAGRDPADVFWAGCELTAAGAGKLDVLVRSSDMRLWELDRPWNGHREDSMVMVIPRAHGLLLYVEWRWWQ